MTAPRFVLGDALREQAEVFARGRAFLGGDDEQAHRRLQEAAAGERTLNVDVGLSMARFTETVTVTALEVARLFPMSRATAVRTCVPFGTVRESHEKP